MRPQRYLSAADSGTFLARRHALFTTGPTGTNVMDLALALRGLSFHDQVLDARLALRQRIRRAFIPL